MIVFDACNGGDRGLYTPSYTDLGKSVGSQLLKLNPKSGCAKLSLLNKPKR